MVPSMVTQPAGPPAGIPPSVAAAGAGGCQLSESEAAASGGAGTAFNDALADACGDAAKAPDGGKGAARKKETSPDASSSSTPTFPAWRLLIALENAGVGDTKAGKGNAKGTSSQDEAKASDADGAANADVAATQGVPTVPVVPDIAIALPLTQAAANSGATEGDRNDAVNAGADGSSTNAALDAALVAGTAASQARDPGATTPVAADGSRGVTTKDEQSEKAAPAGDASRAATRVADTAGRQELANLTEAPTVDRGDSDQPIDLETMAKAAATAAAKPAPSPTAATKAAPGTPATTAPTQGVAAPSGQGVADSSDAKAAANASPNALAALAAALTSSSSGAADTRAASRAGDPGEATTESAIDSMMSAALANAGNGSRDTSSQHGDSDAHGRNTPEPVMASRAVAFATAMTLVSSPDGTLRMASPLAGTSFAQLLPEQSSANVDQMVQTMRVMVRDTVTEATVHLHPEHFGEVTIQVRLDGKNVSAFVNADSAGVREWLQGQESTIRNGLSQHGLQLERLVVQRDGRQDRRQQEQPQQGPRRRRGRDESDTQQTFEVSV